MNAIVTLPSHKKVAWAWLDKLLSSKPSPRDETPVPAREMTPRQRVDILEGAFEEIKAILMSAIRAEIPNIIRHQDAIARKHGIDPKFLNWYLVNGQHWPSVSSKTRRGLRALQSLAMWFGMFTGPWRSMVIPDIDQARNRDAALRELGDWFVKSAISTIERKYVAAVWKKSRELVDLFKGPGHGRDPKASVLLMRDFEKRLVGDRFQEKPAVQAIVDLLD